MNNQIVQYIVGFFSSFPPELAVFILAFLPVTEKVALAIGLATFKMGVLSALVWVLLGNLVPIIFILILGEKFHILLSKNSGFFGSAWAKTITHAQDKFARYQKYELWGIFLFMALPLPVNGGISASLIALILGVPAKKSWPYLFAGVLVSNFIILLVTLGILNTF